MNTRIINQSNSRSPHAAEYFYGVCHGFKNMYNTAQFYIRNLFTGLQKEPYQRTDNEKKVIYSFYTSIGKRNARNRLVLAKRINTALSETGLKRHVLMKDIGKRIGLISYPRRGSSVPSWRTLDAAFRFMKNERYYALPSQVNTQAIKKARSAWDSYFASISDWKLRPEKYTGRPRLPKYVREDVMTATFTNQVANLKLVDGKHVLLFPKSDVVVTVGKLPGKYVRTEVKPSYGGYKIIVTTDNKFPEVPVPSNPERIIGIDLGVDNFLAVSNNFGDTPYLIKGGAIKSENRLFNKRRAKLLSELTKGEDSTRSNKDSHALDALSRKRDDAFRDLFYKVAHFVCRKAVEQNVDLIVIGHNSRQKDSVNIGSVNNQAFVSIPHARFISILKIVALKYSLPVFETEESYTSKASFLDMDELPVYKKDDSINHAFSGKRSKRGLYISKNGTAVNADINGASNIIRKAYPNAFDKVTDFSYLYRTTLAYKKKDIFRYAAAANCVVSKEKQRHPGPASRIAHREHLRKKHELMEVFNATKSVYVPKAVKAI